jgi:hypothetical protein
MQYQQQLQDRRYLTIVSLPPLFRPETEPRLKRQP